MFNSCFPLLFQQFGIIYLFWEFTWEISYTMPTWDHHQNSVSFLCLHCQISLELCISSLTAFLCNSWLYVTFKASLLVFFLLWLAFLCHVSILIAIEVLLLPILKVVIGFPNIYGLVSPFICCSCAHFVVLLSFCGLIPLSYWHYHHFPLLECLWYSYGWITQYCFDNVVSYILLSLLERFDLPFGICCLHLVTECCLNFFDKIFSILSSKFFV